MGKKDTLTKDYMKNTQVFADAFNHLIYQGKKKSDLFWSRQMGWTKKTTRDVQNYR